MTNAELEAVVDTSDEWISQRTGIRARHLLAPGEAASELGHVALQCSRSRPRRTDRGGIRAPSSPATAPSRPSLSFDP